MVKRVLLVAIDPSRHSCGCGSGTGLQRLPCRLHRVCGLCPVPYQHAGHPADLRHVVPDGPCEGRRQPESFSVRIVLCGLPLRRTTTRTRSYRPRPRRPPPAPCRGPGLTVLPLRLRRPATPPRPRPLSAALRATTTRLRLTPPARPTRATWPTPRSAASATSGTRIRSTPTRSATLPYTTVTLPLPGTPVTPNPNPTSLLQPQYAIGLETMGNAANGWTPQPLSDKQVIQTPGWTPSPTATKAAGLMHYWQLDGVDTVRGSTTATTAAPLQYPEWANEGHRNALDNLKAVIGSQPAGLVPRVPLHRLPHRS